MTNTTKRIDVINKLARKMNAVEFHDLIDQDMPLAYLERLLEKFNTPINAI